MRDVCRRFVRILDTYGVTSNPFIQEFGERVRALRLEHELTQEALADLAGMHITAIGHIERATRSSTLDTVFKLARALRVQPQDLIPEIDLSKFPPPGEIRRIRRRR